MEDRSQASVFTPLKQAQSSGRAREGISTDTRGWRSSGATGKAKSLPPRKQAVQTGNTQAVDGSAAGGRDSSAVWHSMKAL